MFFYYMKNFHDRIFLSPYEIKKCKTCQNINFHWSKDFCASLPFWDRGLNVWFFSRGWALYLKKEGSHKNLCFNESWYFGMFHTFLFHIGIKKICHEKFSYHKKTHKFLYLKNKGSYQKNFLIKKWLSVSFIDILFTCDQNIFTP